MARLQGFLCHADSCNRFLCICPQVCNHMTLRPKAKYAPMKHVRHELRGSGAVLVEWQFLLCSKCWRHFVKPLLALHLYRRIRRPGTYSSKFNRLSACFNNSKPGPHEVRCFTAASCIQHRQPILYNPMRAGIFSTTGGSVEIEEFLMGCLRLRGNARARSPVRPMLCR